MSWRDQNFIFTLSYLLLFAHAFLVLAPVHTLPADRCANDNDGTPGSMGDGPVSYTHLMCIRDSVSFWPIDARGLVAQAPLGDATQGSQGNSAIYTGAAASATTNIFQQSQDTLYALAGDTGGKALFDTNDLDHGLVLAQDSISDYYLLGYYATNTAKNGHFRRVKITLNQNLDAKLDYHQGYYADKEFSHFTTVDKERQLEDALMLEDPITELSIAMEIDYFQLNRAEYLSLIHI